MSLIEIVLASALFIMGVTGLVGMLLYGEEGTVSGGEQTRAVFLAEEGVEAIRNIRDEAWNEIEAGAGAVQISGDEWVYVPGPGALIDDFYTRTVTIEDVCRDAGNEVTNCPGVRGDPYTKKATVTVSWDKRGVVREVERITYLTNWSSRNWVQTNWSGGPDQAIWSDATRYDTDVSIAESEVGGQLQLAREEAVQSEVWEYDVPGDHDYDPSDIEVTAGYAQLKGDTTERTNAWSFDTPGAYTYDTDLIAVSSGAASLIDIPSSSTSTWDLGTPSEYTYDTAKIEIGSGVAALKRTYDASTMGIWHFDGASAGDADEDESVNGNDLNFFGNPTYGLGGHFSTAMNLDASGDYGERTDATQTGLDITGPLTIDAWVYKNAYTSGDDYIVRKWTSGSNRSYFLRVGSTGALTFYVQNGSYSQSITSSAGVVVRNTWVHVAAVYDGSYLRLFVNGLSVATPRAYNRGIQNGGAPFWVSSSSTNSFQGRMDELRVSNTARWTSNFTPSTQAYGIFATDDPIVSPTGSYEGAFVDSWASFTETATKNGGEIYYQLSDDDGTTWYYWNGSSWVPAGVGNYNTAAQVHANIAGFPATEKRIRWRAFLSSDGTQQVTLDTISIGYTNSISGYATNSPTIMPTSSFVQPELTAWHSFTETATKNGGEIYYQLSDDDGTTWYYWDGDAWTPAGSSDHNTASDIDAHLSEFPITTRQIFFKAFLESDGAQAVSLADVTIGYYATPDEYTEGLWHLDEASGNFVDDSGGGNHLAVSGNPTYSAAGYFDTSVLFDASGDYGEVSDTMQTGLDITGPMTIEMWAYRTTDGGDYLASKWTSGADRSYRVYTASSGRLVFEVQNGGNNGVITSSSSAFGIGTWHHLAAVYDGSYLRLFVDGTSVATPVAYSSDIQDGGAPFRISYTGTSSFPGYIDEVRISSVARWTSDFTPPAIPYSNVPSYPSDGPTITPVVSFEPPAVEEWNAFIETAEKNGGEIYYQLSDDDGATWYYWTGASWAAAFGSTDYSTAEEVNVNISDFSATNDRLLFRVFLVGDGMQFVRLDSIRIAYTTQGGDYYGNRFLTIATAAGDRINTDSREVSFRFTAQATKTVDRIRIYQEANSGSSTFRVGLQADDGAGNPTGVFLGDGTYSGGNGWNSVNIADTDIVAGETYHIVILRNSGSGWRQYRYSTPDNNMSPYDNASDPDMDVLWTTTSGSSWTVQGWQPIYILEFTDGYSEGNPYYTSLSDDATYTRIYGNQQFGETITITGGDKHVSSVGFYTSKRSAGAPEDDLYAMVYDMSLSEEVTSGVVTSASAASQTFSWQTLHFSESITLTEGHQYRVSLSSPSTSASNAYNIYVMQTANNSVYYSSSYIDTLSRYCRSTTGGSSWAYYNYYDMAFRFVDYGATSAYSELGYLVSSAYDMGDVSPVQAIEWDEVIPTCSPDCEIDLQVRTAPDGGGAPGAWTDWYGSAGAGSFFSTSTGSIIPSGVNGNRWVQYKATLIGDGADTPVLEEVRINYR